MLQCVAVAGTIPEWSKLAALKTLYLSINKLTGALPAALPPGLSRISLEYNSISGECQGAKVCISGGQGRLSSHGIVPAFNLLPHLGRLESSQQALCS